MLQDKGAAAQLKFSKQWISSHVAAAAGVRKPLVLGEFGMKGCSETRAEFYQKVLPTSAPFSHRGAHVMPPQPSSRIGFQQSSSPVTEKGRPSPRSASECAADNFRSAAGIWSCSPSDLELFSVRSFWCHGVQT